MTIKVGVLKEVSPSEKRVSIVPEGVGKAKNLGLEILVEKGAGSDAFFSDDDYTENGAEIVSKREELLSLADVLITLQRPEPDDVLKMKREALVIGMIMPGRFPGILDRLAERGTTVFSLELMPRITRAQTMDVLSSQSSVAGYRSAILAAANSPRMMPMLTTAAGTVRPSKLLVIGAGVAGLMAIATARRLGANVSAFDVRRTAGDDVRSLGAKFLETTFDAVGEGGYARDLTQKEKNEQQSMLRDAIAESDAVITAASVPGRTAPAIVTLDMVRSMKAGSVIVDLSAESGGNCEITQPGRTVIENGVKVVGPENLPSEVPYSASRMFSRNMLSFLELLLEGNGSVVSTFDDEILKACLVARDGKVLYGKKSLGRGD